MSKKTAKGKFDNPKLMKDSELNSKRNAKYLDVETLSRPMVERNKWWMGNATAFKKKLTKNATIAEKILMKTQNKNTRAFATTKRILRVAFVGTIAFLAIVVTNNLIVLVTAF